MMPAAFQPVARAAPALAPLENLSADQPSPRLEMKTRSPPARSTGEVGILSMV